MSNELGAGNVKGAKKATSVTVKLSLVLALGLVVALLVGHDGWVGLFSSSHVIKKEFTSLRFFLAATITLDTVQSVLSGKRSLLFRITKQRKTHFFYLYVHRQEWPEDADGNV